MDSHNNFNFQMDFNNLWYLRIQEKCFLFVSKFFIYRLSHNKEDLVFPIIFHWFL